ncbi:hypothetical protein KDK95_16470 [Actinospica sp. MGRD01-02]|uniref:Uncharacterized protein n=1 Tax=Actinospica acidithermotolerans TaxID=2828514 RepID=A0A941ECG9_9ACTN|nr:hypothetical protein [Actinospica acidithermotolerans]MBR7827913.1 hypothetical protein [Actinospica acidithermotolerans]
MRDKARTRKAGALVGAKTALLIYAAHDAAQPLRTRPIESGRETAEALLRRIYPDWQIEPYEAPDAVVDLSESVYPPQDVAYVACFPGLQILCDRNVMTDYPSRLPQRYLDAGQSSTVILHAMHSASDTLAFAVWKEGLLGRSLSISPHGGIAEDLGNRLGFEEAYWAGEHPVRPTLGPPGGDRYPLPFHPLALGEAALRALAGFVIEGRREPGDIDASAIPVHGFELRDPAGPTREERDAERLALIARMPPRRSLYL